MGIFVNKQLYRNSFNIFYRTGCDTSHVFSSCLSETILITYSSMNAIALNSREFLAGGSFHSVLLILNAILFLLLVSFEKSDIYILFISLVKTIFLRSFLVDSTISLFLTILISMRMNSSVCVHFIWCSYSSCINTAVPLLKMEKVSANI